MGTNNTTILFTGDLNISGGFVPEVKAFRPVFSSDLQDELNDNDFVIANLEGPTTNKALLPSSNTMLKSPIETIAYLCNRNINVFNLANNHIFDANDSGVLDTISQIKKNKALFFGISTNNNNNTSCILKRNGIKIGLIGIADTFPTKINSLSITSSKNFKKLTTLIQQLASKTDHIIINFHGGEEYTLYPSPVKRRLLKKIAKIKAVSIVISHHSHTFQGYETINKTPVFYSLGNFIFDIPNHKLYDYTDFSGLVKFSFSKTSFTFNIVPIKTENNTITLKNVTAFNNHIQNITDFSNYKNKWQKEAYRVLFRDQNPKIDPKNEPKNSLQKKRFYKLLLSKQFYDKLLIVLKDKTMFSLYVNAVIYKIKKRYGRNT